METSLLKKEHLFDTAGLRTEIKALEASQHAFWGGVCKGPSTVPLRPVSVPIQWRAFCSARPCGCFLHSSRTLSFYPLCVRSASAYWLLSGGGRSAPPALGSGWSLGRGLWGHVQSFWTSSLSGSSSPSLKASGPTVPGSSGPPDRTASTSCRRVRVPDWTSAPIRPGVVLLLTSSLALWISGSLNNQCWESAVGHLILLKRAHDLKTPWWDGGTPFNFNPSY